MATTTNKVWQKDSDTTAIDQDAFINAFLDDLDASLFGIGANSAKPGSPDEGDTFYDTGASRFIKYNGSTWVQVMPDAANVIDSDHYVDGSIDTVHLSTDAVTGAKIADDAIDSEHYTDASIDAAHLASNAVTTVKVNADAITGAKIADDAIDSEHYTDASIDAAHLASNAVTTVKLNADAVTGAKIADDALDSEHYTDGSIDTAHLASDVVTGAKIADDAVDSEHYTDGSIDAAHIASSAVTTAKINADAVTGAKIADDALDSEHYTDGSIDTAHIADDAISLAKIASGTDGELITWDASGNPAAVAAGSSPQVLTSNGAGAAPTFQAAAGGGKITAVAAIGAKTSDQSSTSDSYIDITGTTATLTTTKGGLLVWATLTADCTSSGVEGFMALQLDSETEVAPVSSTFGLGGSDQNSVWATCYAWTGVSNASHTVDVRFKRASHTSGTWEVDTGTLIMMEFDD